MGNTDVSKGTIYDVPGTIANMKRPLVMILDGEFNVEWEKMDNLTVAIGLINQIQKDAKQQKISTMPIKQTSQKPVTKAVVPPSPSSKVRKSLQTYATKR